MIKEVASYPIWGCQFLENAERWGVHNVQMNPDRQMWPSKIPATQSFKGR
jgi:hypothetical protein